MRIEHSSLRNDFLAFWFETKVDGKVKYETDLDYLNKSWKTKDKDMSDNVVFSGKMREYSGAEEERIRNEVTRFIETK